MSVGVPWYVASTYDLISSRGIPFRSNRITSRAMLRHTPQPGAMSSKTTVPSAPTRWMKQFQLLWCPWALQPQVQGM